MYSRARRRASRPTLWRRPPGQLQRVVRLPYGVLWWALNEPCQRFYPLVGLVHSFQTTQQQPE